MLYRQCQTVTLRAQIVIGLKSNAELQKKTDF